MKVGEEINLKRLQDLSQECNAMRPMKVLFSNLHYFLSLNEAIQHFSDDEDTQKN